MPALKKVAGSKPVVGQLLQSHASARIVEDIDNKVDSSQSTPDDAVDLGVQWRLAWGACNCFPIAATVLSISCSLHTHTTKLVENSGHIGYL